MSEKDFPADQSEWIAAVIARVKAEKIEVKEEASEDVVLSEVPEFSSDDLPFFNFDEAAGLGAAEDHSDSSSRTLSNHPEWDPASEPPPDHAPDENLPPSPHDKPNHGPNDEASGNRHGTPVIPVPQDVGLNFSRKKRSFAEFYEEDRREFEMTLEMVGKAMEEVETAIGKASKILKEFRMKRMERLLFGEDGL